MGHTYFQDDEFAERILTPIFEQYTFTSFDEFEDAIRDYFNTPRGHNANLDEEDLIALFQRKEVKEKLKRELSKEEYNKLYGDGDIVRREVIRQRGMERVITIRLPKIKVRKHRWKGRTKRGYVRTKPQRWTSAQTRFLQVRKLRRITPKQVINEFNAHFKNNPRTPSSIRTKYYRISAE